MFSVPWTLVDPPLAPTVHGPGCPLAPSSDQWYAGLGVSLGDSNACGGGWTRCPCISDFELGSPRHNPFSVMGVFDANCAQSGPFLAIFWPFLGHTVELEGNKGLFVTWRSRRTWTAATVSLRFAVLNELRGRFGPKKGWFKAQNAHFLEGISQHGATTPARHR